MELKRAEFHLPYSELGARKIELVNRMLIGRTIQEVDKEQRGPPFCS